VPAGLMVLGLLFGALLGAGAIILFSWHFETRQGLASLPPQEGWPSLVLLSSWGYSSVFYSDCLALWGSRRGRDCGTCPSGLPSSSWAPLWYSSVVSQTRSGGLERPLSRFSGTSRSVEISGFPHGLFLHRWLLHGLRLVLYPVAGDSEAARDSEADLDSWLAYKQYPYRRYCFSSQDGAPGPEPVRPGFRSLESRIDAMGQRV
jgi:hypothetical protein